MEAIVRVVVHLACFALALYAMQALNYGKTDPQRACRAGSAAVYSDQAMCIALLAGAVFYSISSSRSMYKQKG